MLSKLLPIAVCFSIFSFSSFSQSYEINLTNGVLTEKNKYEFDVIIKSLSGNFELTSYQVSLSYNFNNAGSLNFSYINGTSQLNNIPIIGIGIFGNNNDFILTFASLPNIDTIGENETKVGRFLLSCTESFSEKDMRIYWNFTGDIVTILTGSGFGNITNPSNHFPKGPNYNILNNSDIENFGIIENFELLQNYPNPFNPSTTIKYKVPSDSFIQIKIFNVLGEEVRSLVNESLSRGVYEVKFDAGSFPSGYYIYALYANNNIIDNKKMILIK
jgi:hypothetical protein